MKKTPSVAALLLLLFSLDTTFAQNLPVKMRLTDDGHRIITGDQAPTGLYDSAIVRSIYLDFAQPNYWTLLTGNYQSKTDLPATMTVNGVLYDSVGVRFKGQTSYSQAQNSQKKSFNITMDYALPDQTMMGYQTLNLNNSFQDPSFLREIFFQHQIRRHIPAASSNYVNLYINGQNWGLYPNVQQLNKDFLSEWFFSNDGANWRADTDAPIGGGGGGPSWGDGTAALNNLGSDTTLYQKYYTLKSSDVDNPWSHLVATCQALNATPMSDLPNVLPNFLDIDRTLWHLASEIAFADDDSYVYKGKMDYYVYYEPETGRITPLEYDGNSALLSMTANWGAFYNETKVNYPLLNRVLAVPIWRQRYLAHLRTIIEEEMNPTVCNAMIDNYKAMIDPYVQADPKKLYTYTQFNSEVTAVKNIINTRRTNLLNNAEVKQVAPTITAAAYQNPAGQIWTKPLASEPATITAQVTSTVGIYGVNLFFSTQLTGNFTPIQMHDDGLHNDGAANDGLYAAAIPGQTAGTWVRFYIEAVANTTARSASYMPAGAEHDVFVYQVQPQAAVNTVLAINEVMASNSITIADPQGDYEDWIELFNKSNNPIDLSGYYLTDNPTNLTKCQIPSGVAIPANGYLIIWADEDSADGATHCNFKLSASGEQVLLLDPNLNMVDSVTFGQQQTDMGYARVPNGTGNFIIQAPTVGVNNNTVGTSEAEYTSVGLTLTPNPTTGVFTVRLERTLDGHPIQVHDLAGRLLFSQEPHGLTTDVSGQNWPAGMYVVRYGGEVRRLVKN
ncbi:MAG: CotH kinase family protein [Saprospiraceae bacterium]